MGNGVTICRIFLNQFISTTLGIKNDLFLFKMSFVKPSLLFLDKSYKFFLSTVGILIKSKF